MRQTKRSCEMFDIFSETLWLTRAAHQRTKDYQGQESEGRFPQKDLSETVSSFIGLKREPPS